MPDPILRRFRSGIIFSFAVSVLIFSVNGGSAAVKSLPEQVNGRPDIVGKAPFIGREKPLVEFQLRRDARHGKSVLEYILTTLYVRDGFQIYA
jgi:hypothetical protein